jgi:hypothetical protein
LSPSELFESFFVEPRGRDEVPVRICHRVDHSTVDRYDGFNSWSGGGGLNLAHDGDIPLIDVPLQGAGLRDTFEGTMGHGAEVTELREAEDASSESPVLGVGLNEAEEVLSLPFPSWSFSEAFEAPLPRLVQLNEELSADISRDVFEPREGTSEFGQLFLLTERSRVTLVLAAAGKADLALFKGEVPEEPQGSFPRFYPSHLGRCGVDAVAENLAGLHNAFR